MSRARRDAQEKLVTADIEALSRSPMVGFEQPSDSISATITAATREMALEKKALGANEADEAVRRRLDNMGFKVGWAMAER